MNLKTLLVLGASMLMSISASAWTKPVPTGSDPISGNQYYIMNVEAGQFMVGEKTTHSWSTTCGLATQGQLSTLTYDETNQGWTIQRADGKYTFRSGDNECHVDMASQGHNYFAFTKQENGNYWISSATTDATWGDPTVAGYWGYQPDAATPIHIYCNSTAENGKLDWIFVTEEDYNAVSAKIEIYQAAVSLGNAIEAAEAAYPGIDLSAQKAVYNNEASTKEELAAAEATIPASIAAWIDAQLDNATLANPIEYTSKIMSGNVCSAIGNWNREFTGSGSVGSLSYNTWSVEGNAGNDGTLMTTPFIENWIGKGSALSDQICHIDTVKVLPGAYKITARVRLYNESGAETISGASLFGNFHQKTILDPTKEVSTEVSTGEEGYFTYNGMLGYYAPAAETYAIVGNDSTLTFGVKVKDANYNWQAHKDYKVYYLGKSDESVLAAHNTEMSIEGLGDDVVMTKSLKDAINGYVDAYKNGTTAEDIMNALGNYNTEVNSPATVANKAAWAAYIALAEKAKTITEDENYGTVPEALDLSDYIDNQFAWYTNPESEEPDLYLSLSTEEVITETANLQALFDKASAATPDNTDVTSKFITNANFANGWTGWSHSGSGGNIAADSNAKCAEAWNASNFDIHQDIANAPAGMYEVQVQGFYRYLRGDNAWGAYFDTNTGKKLENPIDYIKNTPAKIYLNDNTTPMANVFDCSVTPEYAAEHWTAGNYYTSPASLTDAYDGYVQLCYPNNMTDAGEAFDRGDYMVSAAGAVAKQGDPLTIGMKGNSNQGGDSWAIFTRFKLIYRGYQTAYITPEVKKMTNDEGTGYLDTLTQVMGKDVREAVEASKTALKEKKDKELFDALCESWALKGKIEESVTLFQELANANADLESALGNTEASDEVQAEAGELNAAVADQLNTETEYTDEDASAKIDEIVAMIKKLAVNPAATLDEPCDVTDAFMTNPGFELGSTTGWTNEGTQSFAAQSNDSFGKTGSYYAERWHADGTLDMYQTIEDLPCGTYKITVDAHASNNGVLYANDKETAISNTTDATAPSTDVVYVYIQEGEALKIGVKGELTSSTWFCVDNFKVYLVGYGTDVTGEATGLENIKETADKTITSIYNVNGMQSSKLQKGINIVRMSNGKVYKVLVK